MPPLPPPSGNDDASASPTPSWSPSASLAETIAALAETLTDGTTAFAFLDTWRVIRHVNPSMVRLLGAANADALQGCSVGEVVTEAIGGTLEGPLQDALNGQATDGVVLTVRYSARLVPVRNGGAVAGVAVVLRDLPDTIAAARERQFMRDVLSSVTGGRLQLCHLPADLPPRLTPQGATIPITRHGGIKDLRLLTQEAANSLGMGTENWFDLETAVGEAAMNALVHAGGGVGTVCLGDSPRGGQIQVWIEDTGKGIAFEHLPRATLETGFTTADTLGHGFKMMLKTADRVWLLTRPTGTIVVLEKDRDTPSNPSAADEWETVL